MQAVTLEVILRAVFGVGEARREELRRALVEILAMTRSPTAIGVAMPRLRTIGSRVFGMGQRRGSMVTIRL